jgi:hypothetical protein
MPMLKLGGALRLPLAECLPRSDISQDGSAVQFTGIEKVQWEQGAT